MPQTATHSVLLTPKQCIRALVVTSLLFTSINAQDVFSSTFNMIELANLEGRFVDQLKAYAVAERTRVEALEKEIESIVEESVTRKNFTEDTFDAQHGFGLLRRLHSAATKAHQMLARTVASEPYTTGLEADLPGWLQNHTKVLPSNDDISGAQDAILRVQRIYNLTTENLLPDEPYHIYSALGVRAGEQEDWPRALQWLLSADVRFDTTSPDVNWTDYAVLHDHLAFAAYNVGDVELALASSLKVVEHNPTNFRVQDNIEWYEYELAKNDGVEKVVAPVDPDNFLKSSEQDMTNYRALCRNADNTMERVSLSQQCRAEVRKEPSLMLRPTHIEDVVLDNDTDVSVRIFRDFLTDDETEHLKAIAVTELHRSVAGSPDGYKPAEYRISKVAWLKRNRTDTIRVINDRIAASTGLNVEFAEELQVSNYGIGGHYVPHHDSGARSAYGKKGARLATFMIYLSDVQNGGATVFPRLGVGIRPKKNDAVFWYNINPLTFDVNERMLHGGCPVIKGSKWVANKWIHEQGNEDCCK